MTSVLTVQVMQSLASVCEAHATCLSPSVTVHIPEAYVVSFSTIMTIDIPAARILSFLPFFTIHIWRVQLR